ncbi:porin [Arsenophonus symbiont of Ornithomya chloropus]|uniref:porin n=1 Tax=Arsenophonus symbiont of Ornithomya chloropus TaxID=634121 RepID=UPI0032B15C6B
MKRNILAIVIPVLLTGTVHAAEIYNKDGDTLDIYGKVDVHHLFSKNSSSEEGDDSRVHMGIKGETQISDKLSGFGRFEWDAKTNKSEDDNKNRNLIAYAGLKFSDFGSLDYGRNYGVLHDTKAWTEVLPLYGGNAMYQVDSYMTSRNRNLLTYRSNDFFGLVDGLKFALQYHGKNTENNKSGVEDPLKNNGDGFGISANYDIGWGVVLGGGYTKSNQGVYANELFNEPQASTVANDTVANDTVANDTVANDTVANDTVATVANDNVLNDKKNLPSKNNNVEKFSTKTDRSINHDVEGWNIGLKYDANNLYLAALYGETHNMTKFTGRDTLNATQKANTTENIEVVAQYFFDDIALKPSIAYVQSKGKDFIDPNAAEKEDLTKYLSLGAFYYFNKHLTAVVDYKINLMHSNDFTKKYGINKDNVVGLGLVYKF